MFKLAPRSYGSFLKTDIIYRTSLLLLFTFSKMFSFLDQHYYLQVFDDNFFLLDRVDVIVKCRRVVLILISDAMD